MGRTDSPIPEVTGLTAPALAALGLVLLGVAAGRSVLLIGWPVLAAGAGGFLLAAAAAMAARARRTAMVALALAFVCGGAAMERKEMDRFRRTLRELAPVRERIAAGETVRLEGVTADLPGRGPDGESLEAEVRIERAWLRGEPVPVHFSALLRVYRPGEWAESWHRGDRLRFLATLSLPRGFRNRGTTPATIYYWNRNNICLASCKSPELVVTVSAAPEGPLDRLFRNLEARIGRVAGDGETAEVLQALLLGRNLTRPDLRNAYVDAGVYHLLVISGSHLTLLALFLAGLLGLARLPARWRAWLLIPLLAVYVDFVQGQVAVVRAFLIVALFLAGQLAWRRSELLNATSLAALLLLAVRPWWIADAGFQLTFAAVFALALAGEPLDRRWVRPLDRAGRTLFTDRVDLGEELERVRGRRLRFRLEALHFWGFASLAPAAYARLIRIGMTPAVWVARSLLASVAVLLVTAPLLAAVHFPVPIAGVLGTALALVLVWPILVLLVGAAVVAAFGGWAWADGLIGAAAIPAEWMNGLVRWIDTVPLWLPPLGAALTAAYLVVLLGLLRGRRPRPGWALAAGGLLLAAAMTLPSPEPPGIRISVLDVGEGDALLLVAPGGGAVLVDTGGLTPLGAPDALALKRGDLSRRVLVPALLESGVRSLNALVLTHFDFDHAGSAPGLLRVFPVRQLFVSAADWDHSPEWAGPVAEAAAERGVPVRRLAVGDQWMAGTLRLSVLHPPAGQRSPDSNQNSLVLLGEGPGACFLLTGDIDAAVEAELVARDAIRPVTVIKAAHHGSRTSTSTGFLQRARPGLAVISSGSPGRFNHPSPVVLERLERFGTAHVTTHAVGQIDVEFIAPGLRISYPAPTFPPDR